MEEWPAEASTSSGGAMMPCGPENRPEGALLVPKREGLGVDV